MLFRRRTPAPFSARLREFLWPRKGFTRGWRYLGLKVLRQSGSPHAIALGVAAGAASSATPFIGFHIGLALVIAYVFSGNLIAAGIATALANPVTIPVILATSYELGAALLGAAPGGRAFSGDDMLQMLTQLDLARLWRLVLMPLIVGSLPLALLAAAIAYPAAFQAARLFRLRRDSRRLARFAARNG